MKIIESSRAPNPRRVRIFLAEKGLAIPREQIDINKLDHRKPEFSQFNPLKQVPVLILDSGEAISETVAICRYFERLHPDPALFGRSAVEEARIEMWNRGWRSSRNCSGWRSCRSALPEPPGRTGAVFSDRASVSPFAPGHERHGGAAGDGLGGGEPAARL